MSEKMEFNYLFINTTVLAENRLAGDLSGMMQQFNAEMGLGADDLDADDQAFLQVLQDASQQDNAFTKVQQGYKDIQENPGIGP